MHEATSKPKGRRGDGSVYTTKDGRLRASLPVRDPLTGKPRRVYLSAQTPAELREKVRKARAEAVRVTNAPTLADYAAAWLKRAQHRVSRATYLSYGTVLRAWVLPAIGSVEVSRLTPAHIEAMQAELAARGLSLGTIGRSRRVVVTVLSDAERDGVIVRNPARLARPPRPAAKPPRALTPEEVARVVDAAREAGTVGSVVMLAVSTGLRRGELLALRWEDVTADTLTVRQGKTARSRRTISLPALAREAIDRQRGNGLPYVFAIGPRPLDRHTVAVGWHAIQKQADVPAARLHDLRHTVATLLLSRGVPVTDVSAMLGHANAAITMGVYAHVLPGGRERTALAVDAALGRES
jgi:integrase